MLIHKFVVLFVTLIVSGQAHAAGSSKREGFAVSALGVSFQVGESVGWNGGSIQGTIQDFEGTNQALVRVAGNSHLQRVYLHELIKPVESIQTRMGSFSMNELVYAAAEGIEGYITYLDSSGAMMVSGASRRVMYSFVRKLVPSYGDLKSGLSIWYERGHSQGFDGSGVVERVYSDGTAVINDHNHGKRVLVPFQRMRHDDGRRLTAPRRCDLGF
jgi:hypothetical protein